MTKQGKEAQKRAICLPPLISIADCEIPVELMACSFVTPFLYNASNNSYVHSRLNKNVATPKFNCTHNKVCVVSCSKDPTSRNTTRREAIGTLFSTAALSITIPLLLAEKPTVDKPEQLRKDVESLKYDEELILNPDPAEKDPLRYQPPPKEPEYRKQEKELIKSEEEKYQNMVKEELQQESELRSKFGNKKK
jgi:hypothetical protein